MKGKMRMVLFALGAGFVVLFGLRLLYGLLNSGPVATSVPSIGSGQREFEFSKKNYASEKFLAPAANGVQGHNVDQKYEKVASVLSRTSAFDQDELRVRGATGKYHALVQYEQSSGLAGHRHLEMAVGVVPSEFDNIVEEVRQIGTLSSIRIDKVDKTGEYRNLIAKKASQEKARDSLLVLKGRAGSIDEMIHLENKLLEIESEIQTLGVSLGEYSQENEFCTIKLTLDESITSAQISVAHRIKVALIWAGTYYLVLLVTLLITGLLILGVRSLDGGLRNVQTDPGTKG